MERSHIAEEMGNAAVDIIKANGGEAMFCRLNVTQESEWASAVKTTVSVYGRLDVLVNNAGVNIFSMVENLTGEQWRQGMAINTEGVFYGVKHGILAMKPGGIAGEGGSIVNISSVTAFIAVAGTACYSASKAAVNMLTKVAAVECGQFKYGIRVNSIHPGVIRTPFTVAGFETMGKDGGFGSAAAAEATFVALHPIGRIGEPEDVGEAVLYLASDASSFVTGSSLTVDGGWTAH
jgi:3alpha(or 20beta)-hydroxysteroid dehydrogenase